MFYRMEYAKKKLNLENYTIQQTTIEEVFQELYDAPTNPEHEKPETK